jgi:hypothetical protein
MIGWEGRLGERPVRSLQSGGSFEHESGSMIITQSHWVAAEVITCKGSVATTIYIYLLSGCMMGYKHIVYICL